MSTIFLRELETLFGWLLAASWQASVLALLVLGLQRLLRGRLNPRWRYALWLLVLARLVLPALPESALSLFQFAPPPPASLIVPVTEPLFVQATLPAPQNAVPSLEPSHPFSVYSLLAIIWLLGAVSLLILTWQVNRRFARQVANSPEITDPELLESFATAKKELGIHRAIRLIESGQVQSPAIMGLFQPTLLLPADVRNKFDARELRFIFLHELAHLKRGDVIVQGLIALLQILHWFNPVLWFAFRRMRIDREPATDALVLSRTGEEEKERYGLMLIKLLEHFNQRHSLPTLVGILEDRDQFKRRFSLIARFTRGAYGWSLLGVLLIGVLAVACLTKSKTLISHSGTQKQMLEAVQKGDAATLQKLIDQGVDPKTVKSGYPTLLFEAGSPEVAEILIAHGVDVNAHDANEDTLVHLCSSGLSPSGEKNRAAIIRILLKHGANPNAQDSLGCTPIVFAQDGATVNALVEFGAKVNIQTKDGRDLMDFDHSSADLSYFQALERHGYSFAPDAHGSQLLVAASHTQNLEVMKWLLDRGVDPNTKGIWVKNTKTTSGHAGTFYDLPLQTAVIFGNTEAARLLISRGAKADEPMITALHNGYGKIVKLFWESGVRNISELCYEVSQGAPTGDLQKLLDQGGPADPPEDKVITPLGEAALLGNMDAVKLLLARHADPNGGGIENPEFPNQTHTTPLWLATRSGHKDIVNYLLSHGAKPDSAAPATDKNGEPKSDTETQSTNASAQMLEAVKKSDAATLQKLIDQGIDPKTVKDGSKTLLFDARSPEVAEILTAHEVDPKFRDDSGITALSSICLNGGKNTAAIARVLLQHGADPNSRDGELKTTPLMGARDGDTVDVLVEHGADLKAVDSEGNNALFWSAWQDASTFEALLRHGFPFDPKKDGAQLMVKAAEQNNLQLVQRLLAHGVDPNTEGLWYTDKNGPRFIRPLIFATRAGQEKIVTALLDHGAKFDGTIMAFALRSGDTELVKLYHDRSTKDLSELGYQISQNAPLDDLRKLLEKGSPADPPEDKLITPLGEAALQGKVDVVQLLMQHGADVNKGESAPGFPNYPHKPVVLAASKGQDEVVGYLLEHGATPLPAALQGALQNWDPRKSNEKIDKIVRLLIDAGALRLATPDEQGSILAASIQPSDAVALKMLLDAGVSPRSPMKDIQGNPTTVIAYYQDFYQKYENVPSYAKTAATIKPLLDMLEAADNGADTKPSGAAAPTADSTLPKDTAELERLPKLQADLDVPWDRFGVGSATDLLSPSAAAVHSGQVSMDEVHPIIARFLWSRGNRIGSPLLYAISHDASIEDIAKLLSQGSPADPPQDETLTPLGAAAFTGDMDAVKLLIARGADVNKGGVWNPKAPYYRMTPLIMAAFEGQDEIVEYLLQHGATPDPAALWAAAYNSTPYAIQRSKDHFEKSVRILIDAGALKTTTPEMMGLILAAPIGTRHGPPNATVLKMFLDAGLNPEAPIPYIVKNGEKPNSVIGFYRELYQKRKDDPVYADQATALKPLLDMLEVADKGAGTKSSGAAAPVTDSTSPNDEVKDPNSLKKDLLMAKEDADARRVLVNKVTDLPDDQFLATIAALGRSSTTITALQSDIEIKNAEITGLLKSGFTEDHPRVQALRAELIAKQEQLKPLVAGVRRAMIIDSQMADSRVRTLTKEMAEASPPGMPAAVTAPTAKSSAGQELADLKQKLLQAKEDANARRVLLDRVKDLPDDQFLATLAALGRSDPTIMALQKEIADKNVDIAGLLKGGVTENDSRIQSLRTEFAALQQESKRLTDGLHGALAVDQQMSDSRVALFQKEVDRVKAQTPPASGTNR